MSIFNNPWEKWKYFLILGEVAVIKEWITCWAVTSMSIGRNALPNRFMECVSWRVPMCSLGAGFCSHFAVHEWLPNDHRALHIWRKSIPDIISGEWTHSRCCRSAPFSGISCKEVNSIRFVIEVFTFKCILWMDLTHLLDLIKGKIDLEPELSLLRILLMQSL